MKNIFLLRKVIIITFTAFNVLFFYTYASSTTSAYEYVLESENIDHEENEQQSIEHAAQGENNDAYNDRITQKVGPSAITWKANGGRFGDNLVSYSKAKWMSRMFDIPLLYLPFPYADELMLHENEQIYTLERHEQFAATVQLLKGPPYALSKNNNTLYICRWKTGVVVDWYDQSFLEEMKKNIAPRYELEKIAIPDNCISIAAHVRNGGTFAADTLQEKERCPLRFLPEEFFIDQIQRLSEMFPEENLYVHIFTDHPQPAKLAKKFNKALNNPRITFGCRIEGNDHKSNVLEDFFSMMDFDCLIRPGSHYSRFVQRLGNNKVVIFPQSCKEIAPGKRVIDTIKIKTRANNNEKWKTKLVVIA